LDTKSIDTTNSTNFSYVDSCGANNCPDTILLESSTKPSVVSVYYLIGTLVALCGLAFFITILFVDNISTTTTATTTIDKNESNSQQNLSEFIKLKLKLKL
jgi:predicted PurR-regulated permease PerM